jgi:hypothetical protein
MDTYMWWWIGISWLIGALMVAALWGAVVHIGRENEPPYWWPNRRRGR